MCTRGHSSDAILLNRHQESGFVPGQLVAIGRARVALADLVRQRVCPEFGLAARVTTVNDDPSAVKPTP